MGFEGKIVGSQKRHSEKGGKFSVTFGKKPGAKDCNKVKKGREKAQPQSMEAKDGKACDNGYRSFNMVLYR